MTLPRPVVWKTATIPDLVRYLSAEGVAATAVICCSKKAFINALQKPFELGAHPPQWTTQQNVSGSRQPTEPGPDSEAWGGPARLTLQQLSSSKNVRLVFCPDITHLRSYLATYSAALVARSSQASHLDSIDKSTILVILNLIQLHRSTSAFSAQGINRTLANAVDAAVHTRSQLIVVECALESNQQELVDASEGESEVSEENASSDLWSEKISILNVTTKSFGVGDRGWVGRAVSLRSIAERWCVFVDEAPTCHA